MASFDLLRQRASTSQNGAQPISSDPYFAARLAKLEIELENMKTTNLRVLASVAGGGAPIAESSMLKIRGTEILQEITSLARRALGPYAQPFSAKALEDGHDEEAASSINAACAAAEYFNNRKLSIYGGSNEIQREIITKAILGL